MLCDQFASALWNVHLHVDLPCSGMYPSFGELFCVRCTTLISAPHHRLYSVDVNVMCFWHCTWSEYLRNCGLVPSMGRFFSSPKHWLWFWDPTQPDTEWIPWSIGWGMMVTSGLHLVLGLRMNGVLLPLLHLLSWHLQRWLCLLSLRRQNMVNGLYQRQFSAVATSGLESSSARDLAIRCRTLLVACPLGHCL